MQNSFGKFVGACNDIKHSLNRCLRIERENNRKKNYEKSLEKRNRHKNIVKEKETVTVNE